MLANTQALAGNVDVAQDTQISWNEGKIERNNVKIFYCELRQLTKENKSFSVHFITFLLTTPHWLLLAPQSTLAAFVVCCFMWIQYILNFFATQCVVCVLGVLRGFNRVFHF